MIFPPVIRRIAACGILLAAGPAFGQGGSGDSGDSGAPDDKNAVARPFVREVWVPAADLDPVLSRYPRAVPLDRDQLFTLLREAHADPAAPDPATVPPERAVLRQARFEGRLVTGPDAHPQVRVEASLDVEAFSDAWADVPLGLPGIALGSVEIDTPASSLRRSGDGAVSIRLQGRGVHRLRLGFLLPVNTGPEGSSIVLPRVDGVGEFTLHLPTGTHADSSRGCAVQPEGDGLVARVALPSASGKPGPGTPDRLSWRTPPPAPAGAGALLQENWVDAAVEASRVAVRQQVTLRPALGRLPAEARLTLPAGARAVRVENTASRWDLGADGLHVALAPDAAKGGQASFVVVYDLPLTLDGRGGVSRVGVPLLEVAGAHGVRGGLVVSRGRGVEARRVEPGAMATPATGGAFSWYEQNVPGFVAGLDLADLPAGEIVTPPVALTLEARLATARFSVDADARADFQPDGVQVKRTLTLHVEEGEVFAVRVRLPRGETLLALHPIDGSPAPDWRQDGGDLFLSWNTGLSASATPVLVLDTRLDLAPPKTGAPTEFALGAAFVPGAERLTGYVALAAAPALRLVTTGGEDRLERRDGRTTPVRGDVAWFYRDDFHLALRVERRAAETEARFTGYALPLAGAVEIHAQLDYHFLYSGVETVKIRVPRDAADAFFFTGANIAERRRDGDVWTIRFQGEQRGDYALGVQATIPAPADRDDPQRFHFRLPAVIPLETARWSGAWAVEANTDTEIRFTAAGANEVDTLHAPALAGYQPRRRIIGVFEFTGSAADAAIDLDGVRHPAAGVAAAVVDRLDLETFASTSGVARHRATLRARTAADGFFNVRLPEGATLWSLTRDGQPVKPVGGAAGELRVELPGGRAPSGASTVVTVYETPGQPWAGAGRWRMAAPGFDPGVPVLQSRWQLHLPDGFDYRFPTAPVGPAPGNSASIGDLLLPRLGRAVGHAMQWVFYYPQYRQARRETFSGIADPGHVAADLPDWMAAQLSKRGAVGSVTMDIETGPVLGEPVQELVLPAPGAAGLRDNAGNAAITRKLASIIIPSINFHGATLGDAIEYLRQESRRLDTDPDADARGVNIFLKLPAPPAGKPDAAIPGLPDANTTGPSTATANTRITLTLYNIPMLEVLKHVASQAGMKVKVEPYAVSIVPVSEQTDVLVTADFKVPPNFLNRSDSPAAPPGRVDAKAFLEASGVTFPPGASATYLSAVGKLVVRNTQENLDLIEALMQENAAPAPQAAPATPPTLTILPSDAKSDGSMVTAEIGNTPPGLIGGSPRGSAIGSGALSQAAVSATGGSGPMDVTGTGSVTIARQDAKTFLEAQGMTFPPGASATYLASSGKLVVRNTRENLGLLAKITGASQPVTAGNRTGTFGISANAIDTFFPFQQPVEHANARIAGLLPLRLDLPANGQLYTFAGGGGPDALDFHYTDWRNAARWRWIDLTLGAVAFLCFAAGWAHPWRRTICVALALTFFPLILAPSTAPGCNALLAGWLWALLGWGVTRFLLRRRPLVAALLCAGALLPSHGRAAPTPTPAPSPELVIVPYDATRPVAGQTPTRYYLPYDRFLDLWDAAKRHRRPPAPEPPPGGDRFTLSAARYDARFSGETLEIDATVDFQTFGDGWVSVPLRFDGSRVGAVTLDGTPAALDGNGALWVNAPGAHRVNVSLRLPAGTVAAGTTLTWAVPPTAATLVTLLLPRADLRVDLWGDTPGGGAVEEITPEGRRLTASVGGTASLNLAFHETAPPAPAAGEPSLARTAVRLVAGPRQETVRAEVNLAFPGGTQDHFSVFLDRTLTLTDLDAPDIKQWRLDTGGDRQTLDIVLNQPARDAYRLTLSADRPIPALPAERRAFPGVSARAGRVEQTAALRIDGAVEITLPDGPPAGARRVEDRSRDGGRPFAAFEGGGGAALVYSVRATTEKRAAHIDYLYQVGRGKIELAASLRLVPATGGTPLLAADLRLPAGFAVQAVAGEAVRQWWRDGDTLSLRFAPSAGRDAVGLVVYLVRQFDRAPDTFALQPLTAAGFAETDGQTVVAADRSFRVGLTLPAGARERDLSEIDPATAAGEFQVKPPLERQRAFRYRGAGFDVSATLENQPARWQAQWVTRASVREGVVAWETHVNVETRQGAVDALEFSLPAGLAEARVNGADVRETVASAAVGGGTGRRTYRVLFQNPLYAGREAEFTVSLELPLGPDGRAALPDLGFSEAGGGRAAGGFLLVENASSGEMTLDPHGLDPAIEKDVPFLPPQIVAGTRFFRAAPGGPWSLGVRVTDLEKTAGRAALVAYAELTSTLRAGGEEWHRAVYRLQNRRLQFLPVELPAGTEFVGARVAGESVRVDAGPGDGGAPQLLVPLLKTRPGELSYDVELIYRRPARGPRREPFLAHWQLADPRLPGVPVEKTLWNVWLPPDARLLDSGGNVEPVVAALSETEKLESALFDLRSLSATYGSARASQQERQRAYRNFTDLADSVKRKAGAEFSLRSTNQTLGGSSLLKQPDAASQVFTANRKQESIRRELDSLNTANSVAGQLPQAHFGDDTVTLDQNRTGASGSIINYGSPSSPAVTMPGNASFSGSLWRDNRASGPPRAYDVNGGLTSKASATPGKGQLALNDSLAVDLPGADATVGGKIFYGGGTSGVGESVSVGRDRLSTARAASPGVPFPLPTSDSASRLVLPAMGLQKDVDASASATANDSRTESLRSVGRISLAVDFPQEGQVYHFEKLQADAHLTLWTARPGRFAPLGWLAVLLSGLGIGWVGRWGMRWRTAHRPTAGQVK